MIRQPALQPLSHDHHQALAVALKLVRADVDDLAQVKRAFLRFWEAHGRPHLRAEEEILLPAYAEFGDPADPLIERVLNDHLTLRRHAVRIERGLEVPLWAVRELGEKLADHVRLEERKLFPRIEEVVPAAELENLAAAFAEAEEHAVE